MWTKEETINTGINIEAVRESKLNPHNTLRDSESTHLNNEIETGVLFSPTSKKPIIAKTVVIITHKHVINCAPLTPTFLPKKPETIEPNMGKTIMAKYIIYILWLCFLLIYKKLPIYLNQWLILHQLLQLRI